MIDALKVVLKKSLYADGVVRGLRECTKALDRREAHLCILADNCTEPAYVRLVSALCKEHSIPLLTVPEAKQLGEMAGLCKLDPNGLPRKVIGASVVCVKNFGEPSPELDYLFKHFATNK
uniref:40S ribosomal protein S12 n=1 Tax=Arcella intermedia TaxID=1963864 RepID=A0A6B2LPZ9_9EUKA